jgi:CRISPR-associated protein Cas2
LTYLVVYDIEDERTRNRVAKTLEGYGRRRQLSVFECVLDERQLQRLTVRLQRALASPEKGEIRVYRVCANCLEASFGLGRVTLADDAPCIIV